MHPSWSLPLLLLIISPSITSCSPVVAINAASNPALHQRQSDPSAIELAPLGYTSDSTIAPNSVLTPSENGVERTTDTTPCTSASPQAPNGARESAYVGLGQRLNFAFLQDGNSSNVAALVNFFSLGIAHGMGICQSDIQYQPVIIQPLDTTALLGYVTAVMQFSFPATVDNLNNFETRICTAGSQMYMFSMADNLPVDVSTVMAQVNTDYVQVVASGQSFNGFPAPGGLCGVWNGTIVPL